MTVDLNALTVFVTVAEQKNFRAAADCLGVTRAAVSQIMRKLEESMGIALVNRTTRSVSLTEAGERLYADAAPALAGLQAAVEAAENLRDRPRGQLNLAVSSIAESFLSGDLLASFAEANPEVKIHVTVTDDEFDIVAGGYDAGVRLGEVIAQDMIALPVSGDQRQLAVASPAYIERHGAPQHPRELSLRRCIGWRTAAGVASYRWEFAEDGKELSVAVGDEITTTDMSLMVRLAIAGAGISFGMEESSRGPIDRGELVPLLEDFCPRFPGFYLYYPSRRNMAPKLRALMDHLRRNRQP
ncbi:DNA-binding transcriptional LysR family regulator [Pseudorhizobium tarimense]|uniref:DNA-binding transcriptional LysR family regulator n=1 Tax=Pseudorhizobium tarimense TaxID=1079109 RepID=A0ABV2H7X1_9HYPH|nr:LysR family transcriptional regulator [Pseudorhizobium tarimense]MCJ8519541.1 LysR family transcriptional regulator [Pseudorhizobium tarimense]